jgi:dethiobiotin synthetase
VKGQRPSVVVLVAGTGTDVGKTWVAAHLLGAWRASGLSVAARKPAQSYTPGAGPTDAEILGAASAEEADAVCLPARSYPVAFAPPMAADVLGLPAPTISGLVGELAWPAAGVDIGLVETAGGVRSPQADDGDVIDMATVLAPDAVVLVADAGLGTINAVRLSVAVLDDVPIERHHRQAPFVVLNRFDEASELHRRNRAWLRDREAVCTVEGSIAALEALAARLAATAPGLSR